MQQCLRDLVVKPAENEAMVEGANSRNPPHVADEEDVVEEQLRQLGQFLPVPLTLLLLDVSMSTAVVATAPTIVAAPTAPQLQGSWAEHTATKAKKPCAASPPPAQQEHKAPSAPQQPNSTSQEKPAQAGATGQETAREETISSADRERYKELL
ncbi:unnamed protein product, partial [Heligmosomoides polygyrus]|uniref:Uncharacterized protein n=1 Tax=Heligmosomoides polygyrus TaxID=6339 RepID=A0A183GXI0_HELPZ